MNPPRSTVVAGATGFIGRALVTELARAGARVCCLVRPASRSDALEQLAGVRVLRVASFRSPELPDALAGLDADVVYNLAAYGVRPEDRDPELMLEGNVGVVTALLSAAARLPARRFVQIGSCSEYSPVPEGRLLDENCATAPASLYGAAKAAATVYGGALAQQLGIDFTVLRLFGVYGEGEASYRLVPYLVDRLRRGEPVDLTPGEQARDLLHVDDVVAALLAAAQVDIPAGQPVYNVCSGSAVRVREVAETVCDLMGRPPQLLGFGKRPYRPDESMWIVGDNRRFCARTGWRPRVGLREGLRRAVEARLDEAGVHG